MTTVRYHRTSVLLRNAICLLAIAVSIFARVWAAPVSSLDGVSGDAAGLSLAEIAVAGTVRAGLSIKTELRDPRSGQTLADGFRLAGAWSSAGASLRLSGAVTAPGSEECVADLIIRVENAGLPLGSMAQDPLLLPRKLLSKLPLVSLRVSGADDLALAVPPDQLAIFDFRESAGGIELRFRFGFAAQARDELRMRAPFACVLYRTEPDWHFRSALKRYYELFPASFEPFSRRQGGWFFAAPTADLPNPQHFQFHEGGPMGWEDDRERGMGTYPYRESSSATVSLPGDKLPESYEEAMRLFNDLRSVRAPSAWGAAQHYDVATGIARHGKRSILADNSRTVAWAGARQAVRLSPHHSGKIKVSGFSRAEKVAGGKDPNYAIYVDVCYANGAYKFGQCARFAGGTHDWQKSTFIIEPEAAVAELRVYCLFRSRSGKAWFDDIHVGPLSEPDTNWLENPSFEVDSVRSDLQLIEDNVCHNVKDEYVVRITDNVSADVPPQHPMNLLRFTLNVDPDIPDSAEHPAVAQREFRYFDEMFRGNPGLDGCYIDSVSSWCYRVLNTRREHWPYNNAPFTYDPGTFRVGAHGRFAMVEYLAALQQRYHPLGKAVFTNIHVNLNAFPLYLVSDVPGIESSLYRDEDSMFFYRASAFQKPLLLLNFYHLQGLEKRELAEAYHLNAGLWGHFPSTGRFVQRAYREYGDVTHAYVPTIKELSATGWDPIPMASGARVERFPGKAAVYFTVRAAQESSQQTLHIEDGALAELGDDLAAVDATWLRRLPWRRAQDGWDVDLIHGENLLTVIRVSSERNLVPWLLDRARGHVENAARVKGAQSSTPELLVVRDFLAGMVPVSGREITGLVQDGLRLLTAALARSPDSKGDLFALSTRREVLQAQRLLSAALALGTGTELEISGAGLCHAGESLHFSANLKNGSGLSARLAGLTVNPGRAIVPTLDLAAGKTEAAQTPGEFAPPAPGTYHVRAIFELLSKDKPVCRVERISHVFCLPALTLKLVPGTVSEEARQFTATIARTASVNGARLRARCIPPTSVDPEEVELRVGRQEASFVVSRTKDGKQRSLAVTAVCKGRELARVETTFWDELAAPSDDLALAGKGAICTVDSCYSGYSPAVLVDGVTQIEGIGWNNRAWASKDNNEAHWIQIDFPEPAQIGRIMIFWNRESERTYSAQSYRLVALTATGEAEIAALQDSPPCSMSDHITKSLLTTGIRLEQPARGGPVSRPGIMWVREICVLPQQAQQPRPDH